MKVLRSLGRLIYRTAYALFALLLALSLITAGLQLLSKEKLPSVLGYSHLVVISGSMQPAVDVGDLLVIHKEEGYRPGDIVTFEDGSSLVTHRLLRLEDGFAITKGDANNTEDKPLALSGLLGKTVLRVPKIGHASLYLRSQQGMLSLTALVVLLIAIPLIFRKDKHDPHKDE